MKRSANTISQSLLNGTKKFAVAAALLLTVGLTSSFATPADDKSDVIKASFRKDFKKAELMGLETSPNYTRLTFKMNDMIMFAFYSQSGDLLAVTRNIKSSQLPIQLMLDLKKNYADYWITDLFEINSDGANSYYVTIENADTMITLRAGNSEGWQSFSKRNK